MFRHRPKNVSCQPHLCHMPHTQRPDFFHTSSSWGANVSMTSFDPPHASIICCHVCSEIVVPSVPTIVFFLVPFMPTTVATRNIFATIRTFLKTPVCNDVASHTCSYPFIRMPRYIGVFWNMLSTARQNIPQSSSLSSPAAGGNRGIGSNLLVKRAVHVASPRSRYAATNSWLPTRGLPQVTHCIRSILFANNGLKSFFPTNFHHCKCCQSPP